MSYWEIVLPSYIENWPVALCSLSISQIDVPLTVGDANRLGANIVEFGECFRLPRGTKRDISDIRSKVAEAVSKMPDGAFIRLGSRSPKDSFEGLRRGSFKINTGDDPLEILLDASERVCADLLLAVKQGYSPHIFVRQWMEIPRWAEFRCFMRDRKLVGISQYHYLQGEALPEIVADASTIEWVIRDQFFPSFREASHLDSVVFDVFLKRWTARDNSRVWEVKLLEINPFFEFTDPCLFDWREGGQFNGSIRFNK